MEDKKVIDLEEEKKKKKKKGKNHTLDVHNPKMGGKGSFGGGKGN